MARTDHNPRNRRLYLPIVSTSAAVAPADPPSFADATASIADTHVAHAIGCGQTARPVARKPSWLKVKAKTGPNYRDLKGIMRGLDLHTVCEEASCPNIYECWEEREATFLILGDRCTRRCGFCDVMTAKPHAVDEGEPERVAEAVRAMDLRYVVLTGVARDDLPDGGAGIWARTIRAVRDAVAGLAEAGCEIVTIGQYLQPTSFHLPVDRWVTPEEFEAHAATGRELGLAHVEAGPLVRSSYHAGRQLRDAVGARGRASLA